MIASTARARTAVSQFHRLEFICAPGKKREIRWHLKRDGKAKSTRSRSSQGQVTARMGGLNF